MKILYLFLSLMFLSCNNSIDADRKEQLWLMIKSNNADSIIKATIEIRRAKDASMISALMYNPYDPRIIHRVGLNGKSIYQIKMEALGVITGKKPPRKLTYQPDSSIVEFYRQELRK